VLDKLPQQDFIIWHAGKLKASAKTEDEMMESVKELAQMIAAINDAAKMERYIAQLAKIFPPKKMWTSAIKEAQKQQREQHEEVVDKNGMEFYRQYHFRIKNNAYIAFSDDGKEHKWSNFTMQPLFHIKDGRDAQRIFMLINEDGQSDVVEFKAEELVSLSKFQQKTEAHGNYLWFGTYGNLQTVKTVLFKDMDSATPIRQLGWQREGFYAFANGAVLDGKWMPVDDMGIVRMGPERGIFYLPAFSKVYEKEKDLFVFERMFTHLNRNSISLQDYIQQTVDVFGDNAKVCFAYLLAALFHDVVVSTCRFFPILNVFGQKASGKTHLARAFMAFFVNGESLVNLLSTTKPALADAVAQTANGLVHIDEYKNTIDHEMVDFLKGLWGGTGRTRMNMDKDKKHETTRVDSGIILTGQEMPTADPALYSRLIFLYNNRSVFSTEEKRRFEKLKACTAMGCTHLTVQLLNLRSIFEKHFKDNFKAVGDELAERLQGHEIIDRIAGNWQVPLAAFRTLETYIHAPFTYPQFRDICTNGIIQQNKECAHNDEMANYWNIQSILFQEGKLLPKADFRIVLVTKLDCDVSKQSYTWEKPKKVLMFNYMRGNSLYRAYGRSREQELLSESALEHYLRNSDACLGKKRSVRFAYLPNGQQVMTETGEYQDGKKKLARATVQHQALCFDYDKLQEQFNISFEMQPDPDAK